MNKLRELIIHKAYVSQLEEDIYKDCLSESMCELLESLHYGYNENCDKLIENCLYYEQKLKEASNKRKDFSKMSKRLGLK
jgi:hypothetical protein